MKTCFDIAKMLVQDKGMDDAEIREVFQTERNIREGLNANIRTDNIEARVERRLQEIATAKKADAASRRFRVARDIIVDQRLDAEEAALRKQGLSPRKMFLTVIEGTHRPIEGGRNSYARQVLSNTQKYVGDMLARVAKEKRHILDLLTNKKFDNDVTDELYELRPGGKSGITGNKDAQYFAKILASYMELSRTEGNHFGASIGHLPGYNGPQVHDDISMLTAGREQWVLDIKDRLDKARTFPDATSEAEMKDILRGIYDTIISGVKKEPSAALLGQRISPANLAGKLGRHRVLHFLDSKVAREYRDMYGGGSTIGNILSHQRNMAKAVAGLDKFGTNPEVKIKKRLAKEKKRLTESLSGKPAKEQTRLGKIFRPTDDLKIQRRIRSLSEEKFQTSINQVTGLSEVPVNISAAHVGSNIRAGTSMAKLGFAIGTAIPSDLATAASQSMFRGNGFWKGLFQQISFSMEQMTSADARTVSYLMGEGHDGLIGELSRGALANDGVPGMISGWANTFFKYTGLTKWTDVQRGVSARVIGAQLGMNVNTSFNKIDWRLQHVLKLNGIDGAKWDVMRKAGYTEVNGNRYLLPDSVRRLDDDQVSSLIGVTGKTADEVRHNLEMDLRGYIADETTFSTLEPDMATRRISGMASHRPGTFGGEAMRSLGQFKAFPIAFANRIFGRALLGHRPGTNIGMRIINNAPHLGTLLASLTVAGYMANLMTDILQGRWPPRDPYSPKVWLDAFVRGGSAGIYGDFLFAQQSRYGQSEMGTLVGPQFGIIENLIGMYRDARDGDTHAAQWLNLAINNTPYANVFYTRPALDILFLNSLREWASPGYISRQERRREKDYGQSYVFPRTVDDLVQ